VTSFALDPLPKPSDFPRLRDPTEMPTREGTLEFSHPAVKRITRTLRGPASPVRGHGHDRIAWSRRPSPRLTIPIPPMSRTVRVGVPTSFECPAHHPILSEIASLPGGTVRRGTPARPARHVRQRPWGSGIPWPGCGERPPALPRVTVASVVVRNEPLIGRYAVGPTESALPGTPRDWLGGGSPPLCRGQFPSTK
jgi:hypothetical protein